MFFLDLSERKQFPVGIIAGSSYPKIKIKFRSVDACEHRMKQLNTTLTRKKNLNNHSAL